MLQSKHKIIEQLINNMKSGTVVTLSDFNHIAMQQTVSKILTRLSEKRIISKLSRGIFWKVTSSDESPDTHLVAKALARENTWRVIPCGETALYVFGLSEAKPKEWTYVSDGAYKKYKICGQKISFKHTTGKVMNSMSERTMIIIQVLKAYGQEFISDELLAKIRSHLKKEEWDTLVEETKYTTQWISDAIKHMFQIPETEYAFAK